MSQKIKFEHLENMLIAKILQDRPHPFNYGRLFPHVSSIGGKRINPDIDILQKIPDHNLAVGYEVKWLHHFEKKGISWYRFYQGIGQVLCYFLHGVTHACLVLGWDALLRKDASRILDYFKFFEKLVTSSKAEISLTLAPEHERGDQVMQARIHGCFGLVAFERDRIDKTSRRYNVRGDPFQARKEGFLIDSITNAKLRNEIETIEQIFSQLNRALSGI